MNGNATRSAQCFMIAHTDTVQLSPSATTAYERAFDPYPKPRKARASRMGAWMFRALHVVGLLLALLGVLFFGFKLILWGIVILGAATVVASLLCMIVSSDFRRAME